jgi:hypothetical protein
MVQRRLKQSVNLQVQLRSKRLKVMLRNLIDEKQANFNERLLVFQAVGL